MSVQTESFIDLLTTTFQATVIVTLIFGLGYFVAGQKYASREFGLNLSWLTKNALAPCFIIYTLAPSSLFTIHNIYKLWPIPVLAVITHLSSVIFSLALNRFARAPAWVVDSLSYNNVSSIPLLTFLAYSRLSSAEKGPLGHLKWRILEENDDVLKRGLGLIVFSWWIVDLARSLLVPITDKLKIHHPAIKLPSSDLDGDETDSLADSEVDVDQVDEDPIQEHLPTFSTGANEETPLLNGTGPSGPKTLGEKISLHLAFLPASLIPGIVGFVIAMVPPFRRGLTTEGGWVWGVVGGALGWLGFGYVVLDVLGLGAVLQKGQLKDGEKKTIPPTLGFVMLICFWRYFALPAISIAIVYGFRNGLPLKAFSHDPVFAYVLASIVISPPNLPRNLTPHLSSIHLSAYFVYFLTSLALAYSISIPGSGISFENDFDVKGALKSALGGGIAGALAMVLQVVLLMWIRTAMNYQYRYGGTFLDTLRKLWREGGVYRFYAGLGAALIQAPVSRFGDTAANAGIFALLSTLTWPVLVKTIAASLASALFRMTLTPIDTLKTTQQTRGGVEGFKLLKERVKKYGVGCLWWGAVATAGATFVGHYPWFGTYNFLQAHLPVANNLFQKLLRQAVIGFAASVVSDTVSNSLRVVKTYRQVHESQVGYVEAAKQIVHEEGWRGLFGRGLITRYVANGLQGILFSVLWKLFSDLIARKGK